MGCKILVAHNSDGVEYACFYDSVTETLFGVLLNDLEEAESFMDFVDEDLRQLTHKEFMEKLNKFRGMRE